ncbi:ankyrin repeat domain-containing protein [Candidatus Micrarchaeota archaeon]|nr:ankyrin repeat domain-containing protein [Candidatus Micrarchaeota archaeon]
MPLVEWKPTDKQEKLKKLIERLSTNKEALDKRLVESFQAGNMEQAKAILLAGADVNATDVMGWTPLMMAAERGDAGFVRLLLERNADVNHKSHRGLTAPMLAAAGGHTEVVEILKNAAKAHGKAADGMVGPELAPQAEA